MSASPSRSTRTVHSSILLKPAAVTVRGTRRSTQLVRMDDNPVYKHWTKAALVARIEELETELRVRGEPAASTGAPTARALEDSPQAKQPQLKKRKAQRKLDPSRYSSRLVAFKLAYIGRNYSGFEFQPHTALSTIEEELWKALVKSCLISPRRPEEVRWDDLEYSKCGRTDRGVSAFGQVIALRVRSNRPLAPKQPAEAREGDGETGAADGQKPPTPGGDEVEAEARPFDDYRDEIQYCKVLNRLLPPDIRILAWCPTTPATFSARFDCRERQYRYFFTQPAYAPVPSSLEQQQQPPHGSGPGAGGGGPGVKDGWLDIEAMRTAAKKFEGLHDFRNFCKVDPCKLITNFSRRIFEADVVEVPDAAAGLPFLDGAEFRPRGSEDGDATTTTTTTALQQQQEPQPQERHPKVYYLHVRGSAFLWHQIRCMVAVLFRVGQGLEPISIIDRLLDVAAEPRRPAYVLAAEHPLVLWDCRFPADPARDDPEATGVRADNALAWRHAGAADDDRDPPRAPPGAAAFGPMGLVSGQWAQWRARKMDELLAAQLLGLVAGQAEDARQQQRRQLQLQQQQQPRPSGGGGEGGPGSGSGSGSGSGGGQRIFDGGDRERSVGRTYVPLLRQPRLPSPEETYERESRRRGYASAADWKAHRDAEMAERDRLRGRGGEAAVAVEGEEEVGE
ncbi:pseudouridine synthase [Xylariaceae sp. FL0804]|nr:pseudouridine synthase [Xylariaceae sp. FL0804]